MSLTTLAIEVFSGEKGDHLDELGAVDAMIGFAASDPRQYGFDRLET